ncbi:hypothetical protein F-LCD7_0284 [Faustovirus]|nr:hypothetical protein F-LCD7_0284 [Faustovirus]QJX73041.1 hypothetical protein F-VV57_0280 [Faustovirus]QJX73548.1 hypothetical protein F-VV63_0282 [Faustovirus]
MSALSALAETIKNIKLLSQQLTEAIAENKALKVTIEERDIEIKRLQMVNQQADAIINDQLHQLHQLRSQAKLNTANSVNKQNTENDTQLRAKLYKQQRDDAETMLLRAEDTITDLTNKVSVLQDQLIDIFVEKFRLEQTINSHSMPSK